MRIKLELPSPKATLLIGCALVGASTFVILYENPWTVLGIFVGVLALQISAAITSSRLEDVNIPLFFAVTTCLNVALFSLPALAIFRGHQKRFPERVSYLVIAWLVFYLVVLLVPFIPFRYP